MRQIGSPKGGYVGRNMGAKVRLMDHSVAWLKVGGVYAPKIHFFTGEAEAGALAGVPKPALLADVKWSSGLVTWGARLMTFIEAPVVEHNPWAGTRAAQLGEVWIGKLKAALDRLAQARTRRTAFDPRHVRAVIEERYGAAAPALDEWRSAHCDLQWSNLTAPDLAILDWEAWGLGPPGYDVATLLAYSTNDAVLVARLERVFAETLAKRSVQATRLYVLDQLLKSAKGGWIDPTLSDPLARMLEAARQNWRVCA